MRNIAQYLTESATRIEEEAIMSAPPFLTVGGTRRFTLLGRKRRTNSSSMEGPIWTCKGKFAGIGKHDARLFCWVQVGKKLDEICSLKLSGRKRIWFKSDETKSKKKRNKENRGQKSACRGHSGQFRSWWK